MPEYCAQCLWIVYSATYNSGGLSHRELGSKSEAKLGRVACTSLVHSRLFTVILSVPGLYAATSVSITSLVDDVVHAKVVHSPSTFIEVGRWPCTEYHEKNTTDLYRSVSTNKLGWMCLIPNIFCSCTIRYSMQNKISDCSLDFTVAITSIQDLLMASFWSLMHL